MKLPSSIYNHDAINDSWFLTLKINACLGTDRPSPVDRAAPCEGKVFLKTTSKIKVSFTEKKI